MPREAKLTKKLAIVMTTYNPNFEYFEKQLKSIASQDFREWDCYVIDDGSRPDFVEKIRSMLLFDDRFLFFQTPQNLGSYYAFEFGLKMVKDKYDFISLSDQDDVWMQNKISKCLDALYENNAVLSHCDLELIDENDEVFEKSLWNLEQRFLDELSLSKLVLRNSVTGCSSLFKNELLDLALPFGKNPRPFVYHHDLWLALHAMRAGGIVSIKEGLIKYRQHGANVVGVRKMDMTLSNLVNLGLGGFITKCQQSYLTRKLLVDEFQDSIKNKHLNLREIESIKNELKIFSGNYKFKFFYYFFCSLLNKRKIFKMFLQTFLGMFLKSN